MSAPHTKRIRPRAVLLGLAAGLVLTAVTPYNNAYLQGTPLGGGHFPLAPFFILVWAVLVVAVINRLFKVRVLSGLELLASWAIMAVVSGIGWTGLARTFFVNMAAPFYFATPGNRWAETLHPVLPEGWYPQGFQGAAGEMTRRDALDLLYNGLPDGRDMGWLELLGAIPWGAWVTPLVNWGVFVLLSYGVMLCLTNLFARQWVTNERMNFPLLRVPQLMTESLDEGKLAAFLLDRWFVVGLLVPVCLHLMNGMAFYEPSVPQLPTVLSMKPYFSKEGLFSGFYKLKLYIYPAFIGFAFLTTRQISFSFWFFFILGGLAYGVLGAMGLSAPDAAMGLTFGPSLSRPEEAQMIGATFVFFVFICWLARRHLYDTLLCAVTPGRCSIYEAAGEDDSAEWFGEQWSAWGAVLGFCALVVWAWLFGAPLAAAVAALFAFFAVMLVATRVICQGGLPYFTLTAAPLDAILGLFGSRFMGAGVALTAVMQKVLFVDLRESLMPSLVHAAKVGERARGRRLFFFGIALAVAAAAALSFVSMLTLAHKFGMRELGLDWATRTTLNVYDNARLLVEDPQSARPWMVTFATAGAVIMLGLVMLYQRFHWWPIHPIGYLAAYSSAMRLLWFSFFIGWLANHLCLHYGGTSLFKKVRLFFIGLIVGDFLMGGAFGLVGLYMGVSYQVLPS